MEIFKYRRGRITCEKLTGRETQDGKRNKSLETKIPEGVLLSIYVFGKKVVLSFSEATLMVNIIGKMIISSLIIFQLPYLIKSVSCEHFKIILQCKFL